MTLLGFDHVQLAMPAGGEAAARRFYGDLLGLAEEPKPAALASRGGCWFTAPGIRLHLGVDPDFVPARKAHPALLVDDLPALIDRLGAAGPVVHDGAVVDGVAQRYVDDPFGNRVELVAAPAPAPFDFATIAAAYDDARGLDDHNTHAWAAAIRANLPTTDRPLDAVDIGSGTGRFTNLLAALVDGTVTAVEPAAAMRDIALAKPTPTNVRVVDGLAEHLPLPDDSVDVAFLFLVWQHLADHTAAASELARVLRPGGVVLIRNTFADHPIALTYFRWFPRCRTIEAATQPHLADITLTLGSVGIEFGHLTPVRHCVGASTRDCHTRLAHRPFSTLHQLTDLEFAAGLAALAAEADTETTPRAWFDDAPLAVFRRTTP